MFDLAANRTSVVIVSCILGSSSSFFDHFPESFEAFTAPLTDFPPFDPPLPPLPGVVGLSEVDDEFPPEACEY